MEERTAQERAKEADRLALAKLLAGNRPRYAITQPGDPARCAQYLRHQPLAYTQTALPELEDTCTSPSRSFRDYSTS